MSSNKLTPSQYVYLDVVRIFGDHVYFCNEQGLAHLTESLSYIVIIRHIQYHVHQYLTTGFLHFQEFSEERLWTDEEEW